MKFVWPPIALALDERAKKIAEGLAAADRAKAELSANKRVEDERPSRAPRRLHRLADAERRALAIIEEAKVRASEEGSKIVAAAKAEAEQQTVKAREDCVSRSPRWQSRCRADSPQRVNAGVPCRPAPTVSRPNCKGIAMAELATIARPMPKRCSRLFRDL